MEIILSKILQCEFITAQIKGIDMKIMLECIIITKGKLFLELWVIELGVVDGRSNKEASNWRLLPKLPFFNIITFEFLVDVKIVLGCFI